MRIIGLRSTVMMLAALGATVCAGCRSARIIERPEGSKLSVKWDSRYTVRVTNRGKTPVRGVRIRAKYWQDYCPPHTCGYVQHEVPEGWFTNEVAIPGPIQPGESCTVSVRRERFKTYGIRNLPRE